MALTLMLCLARLLAAALVIPVTANFEATYENRNWPPFNPAILDELTMTPPLPDYHLV